MSKGLHLRFDPVGGIAGDMVCAALLDAFPDHLDGLRATIAALAPPAGWSVELESVAEPTRGHRFRVVLPEHPDHGHRHWHWREIRDLLERRLADPAVRARALDIFTRLAEAEARVHGVAVDAVEFHEVGDWDSVIDVVGAAYLLERIGVTAASCGALPLGGGTVRTAHGELPVPAPATLALLEGYAWHDDGIGGERVTPTGAAIVAVLALPAKLLAGTLRAVGTGYGTRRLGSKPNCLRALCFEGESTGLATETLLELAFDVDDQSAEDLADALERLRGVVGVVDVQVVASLGKRGRLVQGVRALLPPAALAEAVDRCLRDTTTIGLRWHAVERAVLPRRLVEVEVEGRRMQVKIVERPGGATAKLESRSLVDVADAAERARLRRLAEAAALRS